jgi:hypothetical protein
MPIITSERAGQIRGQLTEKYGATWMHHYHEAIEDAVLKGIGAIQVSVQESAARTDEEIVEQTEALAVWLLSWGFNHQPVTDTPMRESSHPFAQRCWSAACHIQEMLTATDPENSVSELHADTTPPKPESLEIARLPADDTEGGLL